MTIYPHYELTLYHTYNTPTHTHMHAGIFVLTLACLVVESYLHTPVNFYALSLAYMTLNFFCILYVAFAGQPSIELEKLLRKCVCLCMSVCVYVMSNSGDVKMQIPPHTHTHTHTHLQTSCSSMATSKQTTSTLSNPSTGAEPHSPSGDPLSSPTSRRSVCC
jgi:hypothetical protein